MKKSAGLLLYRVREQQVEVLLVHPGGPFWKNKDMGAWSIPKGEYEEEENALSAAKRELKEETGISCSGPFIELPSVKQKSGKVISAWAVKKDVDIDHIKSNHFEIEWPPRSGIRKSFPEIDQAAWFSPAMAREKINPAQITLIDALIDAMESGE